MKSLITALLILPCFTQAQKWTESVDQFTKNKTWSSEVHKVKIKTGGLFDDSFLSLQLLADTTAVMAYMWFNTSLRYEASVNEETRIAFLYENDSTATIAPVYAKTSSQQLMGKLFYISTLGFDPKVLNEPIKAIRFKLADALRDYNLKDGGGTSLLTFVNSHMDILPKR